MNMEAAQRLTIEERCLEKARSAGVLHDTGNVDDPKAAFVIGLIRQTVLQKCQIAVGEINIFQLHEYIDCGQWRRRVTCSAR